MGIGITNYKKYNYKNINNYKFKEIKLIDKSDKKLNKDDLVFDLMIRQPDFVYKDFFNKMLDLTKSKKPNNLLDKIELKKLTDGKSIQMLHIGSYDNEPESFKRMEQFARGANLKRKSKILYKSCLLKPK